MNYANHLMEAPDLSKARSIAKGKKCPECGSRKVYYWGKKLLICAECHNKFEPKEKKQGKGMVDTEIKNRKADI
jgi:ribosomal protein L37AE/L43A